MLLQSGERDIQIYAQLLRLIDLFRSLLLVTLFPPLFRQLPLRCLLLLAARTVTVAKRSRSVFAQIVCSVDALTPRYVFLYARRPIEAFDPHLAEL